MRRLVNLAAVTGIAGVSFWGGIQAGDPVPGLSALGEFGVAYNAPGDFNRMIVYEREVPNSWHKIYWNEEYGDTMVVAAFPKDDLAVLMPRPTHWVRIFDPSGVDTTAVDYWFGSQPFMYPTPGDTLEWDMYDIVGDSMRWAGTWYIGEDDFCILAVRQ